MRPTRLASTLSILSIALVTGCSIDSVAAPEGGKVTPPSALYEVAGATIACPPTVPPGYTLVFCFDFDLIPGVWHGFIVHQPGIPNALSHEYLLISPTGFQYIVPGTPLDHSVSSYTFQPEFNGVTWYDVFRFILSDQSAPQRMTLAVARRALTPALQTAAIAQQIAALVSAGTLSSGLATSLTQQLDAAIASLDAGRSTPAANVLKAFVHHTLALMSGPSPALSAADGQALVGAAQAVIARISQPNDPTTPTPFTGTWTGTYSFGPMTATLLQAGSTVTGSITDAANCQWAVSGSALGSSLSLPIWVLQAGGGPCLGAVVTMSGSLDGAETTITGTGSTTLAGGGTFPWTFSLSRN